MPLSRPTEKVLWTYPQAPRRQEPSSGLKNSGWGQNDRPPFKFFNWLVWNLGTWIDWLEQQVDQQAVNVTPITNAQSPYTVLTADRFIPVDASAGAVTLNLPTAIGNAGLVYYFKKTDASANTVTVDGFLAQTIDKQLTLVLDDELMGAAIVSDGAAWWKVA